MRLNRKGRSSYGKKLQYSCNGSEYRCYKKQWVTDTDYDLNNPNDLSSFYTDEELATFADNEVKSEEYEK